MRLVSFILLTLAAPLAAEDAWRFGDRMELEPAPTKWSEVSLLRRALPIADTRTAPIAVDYSVGLIPKRPAVTRVMSSDLLERPAVLADLRDGKSWHPILDRFGFWDAMVFETAPELPRSKSGDRDAFMFCTVYYTPLESGFTAERGFDVTPETRAGLGGRTYAHDFLRTVITEGFGRISKPVGGKKYIKFDGRWGYADRILGNRNNTLIDRRSAAVYRKNPALPKNTKITVLDADVFAALGSMEWQVADTGGGLHLWQMDLYWGEDLPLGPGMDRFRPAGCPFAVKFWLPVAISKP